MVFAKILCPIDFSEGSRKAMTVAARLAAESHGSLILLHVWQMSAWAVSELTLAPQALQDLIDANEAELASWKVQAQQLGAREVATRTATGAAWDKIVELARVDTAIDLVVMGTHGRTGLPHALLGSVAEKVVRHAPCQVLVVRDRGE